MNAATPFRSPELSAETNAATTFSAIFEHAPIAVARCNPQGVIVEMNPAFERSLVERSLDRCDNDCSVAGRQSLRLCELVLPKEREKTDLLLRELLDSRRDSFGIDIKGAGRQQLSAKWTAWRQPACGGEPDHVLLMAEPGRDQTPVEDALMQTQRWEAVGRMAGGVVHDFNNLLTGVMLYCDLLLTSLDSRDRRRRYADEIRSAVMQATGLVQQLLVFARPHPTPIRDLNLNAVARTMHNLLTRLIGENIVLDLRLDPEVGAVNVDQSQAQQILLNLVLNARDAMPDGGRITIETSNCKFQPITPTQALSTPEAMAHDFPCVLLVVGDNGHGMNAETLQHIFEPFFTTKNAGKGTGLGLTTVRSIVTTNRGLIHFESEPDRGTRVMILFPRASRSADPDPTDPARSDSELTAKPFHEIEKEPLL